MTKRQEDLADLCEELGYQVKSAVRADWDGPASYALLMVEAGPRGGIEGKACAISSNIPRPQLLTLLEEVCDRLAAEVKPGKKRAR